MSQTTPTAEDLAEARRAARAADEQALDLQRDMYAARRRAKALWAHYDSLVLMAEGQQTLDFTDPLGGNNT